MGTPGDALALRTTRDLLSLTKPRVTGLVVLTAWGGMAMSRRVPPAENVLAILCAIALVVAAANTLNCFLERDSDRLMGRTRDRPLPASRLSAGVALGFGLGLAAVSLPWLLFGANVLTAALGGLSLVVYVALYTPLKRKSPLALYVGAVPGALPPLMGVTAATGELDGTGLALFALLLVWQIPHFLAIGIYRAREYQRAGLRALPVVCGCETARRHALVAIALLAPLSLSLAWPLAAGALPACLAAAASVAWFAHAWLLSRRTSPQSWARRTFLASLGYLLVIVCVLLGSGLLRSS